MNTRIMPRHPVSDEPPADATPEQLQDAVVVLANWREYPNHCAAARALRVSFATLAHWKRRHPRLQMAWDKASPLRMLLRCRPEMVRIDKQGHRPPRATRRAWAVVLYLVRRVPAETRLTEQHERSACQEVGISIEDWWESCRQWPKIMAEVRRQRRDMAG